MAEKRSDAEMVDRLLERCKLVVAVSEEISVESKLEIQPMLRELQRALALPEAEQNRERVLAYHGAVLELCEDYADVTALMTAVGNFVTYL